MTISEMRTWGKSELSFSSTPSLDIDCLLVSALEKTGFQTINRSFLLSHNQDRLLPQTIELCEKYVYLRKTGLPIAYILEEKEFFGYSFYVNPNVLIPKPDTELLIEKTLEEVEKIVKAIRAPELYTDKEISIADICTGSGCIAITLLLQLKEKQIQTRIFGTDISEKALEVAKINRSRLLESQESLLSFYLGDLTQPLPQNQQYSLIVSNPPYVPCSVTKELLLDGRNEPSLALDGDTDIGSGNSKAESSDGLAIIRRLIPQVWDKLKSKGVFLIETGEYNAGETAKLMTNQGFVDIVTYTDLGGQPRVTRAIKP
jgi:release factor glutamine methyltransferase